MAGEHRDQPELIRDLVAPLASDGKLAGIPPLLAPPLPHHLHAHQHFRAALARTFASIIRRWRVMCTCLAGLPSDVRMAGRSAGPACNDDEVWCAPCWLVGPLMCACLAGRPSDVCEHGWVVLSMAGPCVSRRWSLMCAWLTGAPSGRAQPSTSTTTQSSRPRTSKTSARSKPASAPSFSPLSASPSTCDTPYALLPAGLSAPPPPRRPFQSASPLRPVSARKHPPVR